MKSERCKIIHIFIFFLSFFHETYSTLRSTTKSFCTLMFRNKPHKLFRNKIQKIGVGKICMEIPYPELRLRNRKIAVAVAVGSLTANKTFSKIFRKRKGSPLYFFLISKLLRLTFAVDRKPQACCCGCGRDYRPQFGVREILYFFYNGFLASFFFKVSFQN